MARWYMAGYSWWDRLFNSCIIENDINSFITEKIRVKERANEIALNSLKTDLDLVKNDLDLAKNNLSVVRKENLELTSIKWSQAINKLQQQLKESEEKRKESEEKRKESEELVMKFYDQIEWNTNDMNAFLEENENSGIKRLREAAKRHNRIDTDIDTDTDIEAKAEIEEVKALCPPWWEGA